MNRITLGAHYLIFPTSEGVPQFSLPLGELEADYLETVVEPLLQPLEENQYIEGAQGILRTWARFSYVLKEEHVCWCIEWSPGLLVIDFSPGGIMRWCALRSPNPEFGGRTATEDELASYDEDRHNPQYHLVFTAWDAERDPGRRRGWSAATADEITRWECAMARANAISRQTQQVSSAEQDSLLRKCQQSDIWHGTITHG